MSSINGLGWKQDGHQPYISTRQKPSFLISMNCLFPPAIWSMFLATSILLAKADSSSPSRRQEDARRLAPSVIFAKPSFAFAVPESVVDEIEELVKMGVDDLFFVDDTITIDKKNVLAICNLIVERGIKIHFKISARVDTINPEVVAALKKAGCYRIHFGIESATPKHLKYLQKGQTPGKSGTCLQNDPRSRNRFLRLHDDRHSS